MNIDPTDTTTHYLTMTIEQLASQISEMGSKQQEILYMHITGHSAEEISLSLNCPITEVQDTINRCLSTLK